MKLHAVLGVLGVATASLASPSVAATIDTRGPYVEKIFSFGSGFTSVYGQTFTVGSENALNAFTFFLGGGPANVRAYVYAWNGHRAGGGALYASDVRAFGGTTGDAFDALAFTVGAVDLVAGQQYVAFLTTAGIEQPWNAGPAWMPTAGEFGSDAYAGGDFVYTNGSFANAVGRNWEDTAGAFGDVQFQADFSVGATSGVPEPAAWAMLIGGFGLAGGAVRRRQRILARA